MQRDLLDKACEAKHARSCVDLGHQLRTDQSAPDPTRALQLFLRACDWDDFNGCHRAARTIAEKTVPQGFDEGLLARTVASACKRGIKSACPEQP